MSRTLNGMERIRRRRTAFALLLMAWPVFMFVFGQVLNLNMFYMAFHNYGRFGTANPIFVGWDNFVGVFRMFDETIIGNEWEAVTNSLQVAGVTLFINAPISLLFSYLLFSKVPAYKTLRALLYLPCVTSAVVLVLIFRGVFESGPLEMVYQLLGIADKYPVNGWFVQGRAWPVIQIFNIWTGFSANMLFFLSAMNRVSDDFVEAAKLDGATEPQIFFKIVLPLISPTVTTIMTISLAAVFGWGQQSMLFMGDFSGAEGTSAIGLTMLGMAQSRNFGGASAYGVCLTLVGAPITLAIRALGRKLSTNEEY